MPLYDFSCDSCGRNFEALAPYDESGAYPSVVCPDCQSSSKHKVPSMFAFNFSNPEGTDRWNSDDCGHDYRLKTKLPSVLAERAAAEAASHMGRNPYADLGDANKYDTGVHDA
jgi:putative FmdB family regulatory protein